MPPPLDPQVRRLRRLIAIAAEMSGHPGTKRAAWGRRETGVVVGDATYDNTINRDRGVGRPIRPTLAVSPALVGLTAYFMRVDGRSMSSPDLIGAVSDLPGVCIVAELDDTLDVLVFCLVEDDQEANRLRESIRARVPDDRGVSKQRVARIDTEPEIKTWTELAKRQARSLGHASSQSTHR